MNAVPRVAIVDDHALVRFGLESLMRADMDFETAYTGDSLEAAARLDPLPDLLILDLDLGTTTADPELAASLLDRGCAVLVVSALASPTAVREMIRAGVSGFVSKRDVPECLALAAKVVLRGDRWTSPEAAAAIAGDPDRPRFSDREERVLVLYASGLTLDAVARRLSISADTASTYLKRVRGKYEALGRDARTKTDLFRQASRDGLLDEQ